MHKGRPSSANGGRGSYLFSKVFIGKEGGRGSNMVKIVRTSFIDAPLSCVG